MKSCMIIEDNFATRKVIDVLMKKSFDLSTQVYEHPEQALIDLKDLSVDLIIFDYYMPNINGEEFMRGVRALKKPGQMATICVTACANRDTHLRLRALGVDEVLEKPLRPHDLRAVVSRLLPTGETTD